MNGAIAMPRYDDVTRQTEAFLRTFDSVMAADMAALIAQPLPSGTDLIDIEFNFDDRDFRVTRFAMTHGAGQLMDGNYYLLRGTDTTLPPPLAMQVGDGDDDDRNGERGFRDGLVRWLADHWARAGGLHLPVPAYACRHDDLTSFDLRTRTWIDDTEKWR